MRIVCNKCKHIVCVMTNPQIIKINIFVCPICGNDLKDIATIGTSMGLIPPQKGE